jgi:hypothetical protein
MNCLGNGDWGNYNRFVEFQNGAFAMPKRKTNSVRISKAKVTDDDRTIYAILRKEFTAADLQKYAEIELLVPADQVLAQLEKRESTRSRGCP